MARPLRSRNPFYAAQNQLDMARIKQAEVKRHESRKAAIAKAANNGADEKALKKKRRFRRKWLSEIKKEQRKTTFALPLAPMQRLIREITANALNKHDMRFQKEAMAALQTAAEEYAIDLNQRANTYVVHSQRSTLRVADVRQAAEDMKKEAARLASFNSG